MRPVNKTLSASGLSDPIVLDYHLNPANTLLSYKQNGAIAQATVQWSPDDPFGTLNNTAGTIDPYPNSYNQDAAWYDLTGMTAINADASQTLGFPARAVRLKNNTYTSGTNSLTVVQSGAIS